MKNLLILNLLPLVSLIIKYFWHIKFFSIAWCITRPKASLSLLLSEQHHFNFWPHVKTTILNFGILWVFEFYVCVCVSVVRFSLQNSSRSQKQFQMLQLELHCGRFLWEIKKKFSHFWMTNGLTPSKMRNLITIKTFSLIVLSLQIKGGFKVLANTQNIFPTPFSHSHEEEKERRR